jgi:hypothetical protein
MRILIINLLAVAALLFSATIASAYDFRIQLRDGTQSATVTTGDTVLVDIYLDNVPSGTGTINMPVVWSTDAGIVYDDVNLQSAPLNPDGPGAPYQNGAGPTYILYTGGMPSSQLNAVTSTGGATTIGSWIPFGTAGDQVQIGWISNVNTVGGPVPASGTNIYIGSILFNIEAGFAGGQVELCPLCSAFTLTNNNVIQDPNTVGIGPAVVLNGVVPEPTTAMLIGFGVLGLAVAGRRRA